MGQNNKSLRRGLFKLMLTLSVAAIASACSNKMASNGVNQSSGTTTSNLQYLSGNVQMSIMDASGRTIYSDTGTGQALTFKAGVNYMLDLNATGFPTGTQFSLQMTPTDVVSGATVTVPLSPGSNSFSVPTQGDYSWQLVAADTGYQSRSKYYLANVTCTNPTFTVNSLDPSAIAVSPGSNSNLYNFSASGVVAHANGTQPYLCAFDPTGTGIVDTAFTDCSQALNNFYVNYVGTRNVGVIVKDACNTEYAVSNSVNLNYSVPAMPGNVFIFGQISNATGTAQQDSRVNYVNYLATNSGGNNIVQPHYSNGTFQITASQNYGMPSSLPFGMQITVKGIQDNLSLSNMSGLLNASNAYISALSYSTDEAGDAETAVTLNSTNCSLSNQGARVLFVQGNPCSSSGMTGDQNSATVEVWGQYTCSVSDTGGGAQITGKFDGLTHIADNCAGGGGGGGGIVPIQL